MNNVPKLAVVISSKFAPNEKNDFIESIKQTCGYGSNIVFNINQNGLALTAVYNKALKEVDADIFIFVHDDVEFLRKGWGAEIVRLFQEHQDYGIIGVAGSAYFGTDEVNTKNSNDRDEFMWWRGKEIYGQVLHRSEGKSWLTAFSPLLKEDLKEVVTVDGLFIAVCKERISSMFDEEFQGFDHYDTSFCIKNFLEGKTKIGVTTNVRLAHNSVGKMKPKWYENRELLVAKYRNDFPLKVKK